MNQITIKEETRYSLTLLLKITDTFTNQSKRLYLLMKPRYSLALYYYTIPNCC